MPNPFQPKLTRLHRAMAWRPDQAGLTIRVHAADDGIHADVNGQNFRLTDSLEQPPENLVRKFRRMLAHYPAPVVINDEPVDTTPYRTEFGLWFSAHNGDLMDPGTASSHIRGPARTGILLDHVWYELGTHSAATDHSDYAFTHYAVPDQQDEQPHFARRTIYTVAPAYRWEHIPQNAPRHRRWEFRDTYSAIPYACCPPPDVMRQLAASQREPLEREALAVIRDHSGTEPVGPPEHNSKTYYNPRFENRSHSNGRFAPLVVYGTPAYVDHESKLDQATSHVIARALYATPTLDLVPVQHGHGDPARPVINCQTVTVMTAEGRTLTLTRATDGMRPDFTPDDPKTWCWLETGCQHITAHLTVTDPDGSVRCANLPMDILCSGQMQAETIWLTTAWTPERVDELEDLLFLSFWPEYDPPEETTDRQYREQAEALATGLLQGQAEGLALEVRQHCDNFHPQNLPTQQAAVMVANHRHSLIWQPAPDDDTPPWLTAAISGQNPHLSAEAVHQQARRILDDAATRQLLHNILGPSPDAA